MGVSSTTLQQRWRRNLSALQEVAPELAGRLAAVEDGAKLALETPAGGLPTARVACDDGGEILLASERDPVLEGRRWLAGQEGLNADTHAVVVVGCGLGYHVAELLAGRKGGLVVVLEPALATMAAALRCQDFSTALRLRRLVLIAATDRAGLHAALARHSVELMLGTQLTQHPPSGRANRRGCLRMQREFTEYLHFVRSAVGTSLQISAVTCDNILANLPGYIGVPGVGELKGAFAGRPAVCVAAGPSLRKVLGLLGRVKGKMPIIAVQTVLRTLLAAGVRPDFVTSLDYSPLSRRFYEGLGEMDDVTLIADPKVNPVAPDSFPGPVRMFYNSFADAVLDEMPNEHDSLPAGATVAHLNLYVAQYLGCDPIILTGQDLGFGGNVYYTPGVPIHTAWSPELNRFCSMEMMEWQRIVRFREHLRKVPGAGGTEIYTDAQMFTYLQQFERDVAAADQQIINASEGGARIAGTIETPFAELVDRFADLDADLTIPSPRPHGDAAARAQTAVECLTNRLAELDRMEEVCRRVLGPLREMTGAFDDPKRFNRLHGKMDPWRRKIDSVGRAYSLVADVTRVAELKRMQMDLARARRDMDEITERREQLARDIQYVTMLSRGIDTLRGSLRGAIERLEAMA